eukprot:103644_1
MYPRAMFAIHIQTIIMHLYIVATLFGLCLCLCGVGLVIRKVENTSNAQVHGHVFDVKSMSSAVSNECEIHYFPDPAPNVQMVDEKESNCDVDTTDIKVWLTDTVTLPMYFDSFIANGFNTLENVKAITRRTTNGGTTICRCRQSCKIFFRIK